MRRKPMQTLPGCHRDKYPLDYLFFPSFGYCTGPGTHTIPDGMAFPSGFRSGAVEAVEAL
jgi:hypothetical protein